MTAIVAEDYISYVDSITYKMCRSFGCINDFDDLRSCGYLGLLEAVERYDSTKNVTFKQFAYIRISGSIVDGMRGLYAGSKKSVTFKKKLEEISSRLGTSDSTLLAAELGMSLDEFNRNKNSLNKMCRANFTDLCPANTVNLTEATEIIFKDFIAIEPEGEMKIIIDEIWDFIKKTYTDRDVKIMEFLYKKDCTMLETSKAVSLTECRISQIHLKIMTDIRKRLFKLEVNHERKA